MANGKIKFRLRDANPDTDASAILSIYTPFVTDSVTSQEYIPPTEAEMKRRIQTVQETFPWLICEAVEKVNDGENTDGKEVNHIAGYAYASKHHEREGYQWTVETGIYLAESFRGKGVGKILYNKLCSIVTQQGYFQALALIAGDNGTSCEFHKRLGFELTYTWKNVANKFGKWVDVARYVKQLKPEFIENPAKPVPYPQIRAQISLEIDA